MTDWQDLLQQIKLGKGEVYYAVSASRSQRESLLAKVYARSTATTKVLAPTERYVVQFFDKVLPAHGAQVGFFDLVNCTALVTKEAGVILFEAVDAAEPADVVALVETVLETKAPLVVTAEKALPGQPMTERQQAVIAALMRLRPRFFTSEGEIKK